MRAHDRMVAGIRCKEVLAALPDYLEGELDTSRTDRIDAHLQGCDWCARFGGDDRDVIAALRSQMEAPPEVPADVHARLLRSLQR